MYMPTHTHMNTHTHPRKVLIKMPIHKYTSAYTRINIRTHTFIYITHTHNTRIHVHLYSLHVYVCVCVYTMMRDVPVCMLLGFKESHVCSHVELIITGGLGTIPYTFIVDIRILITLLGRCRLCWCLLLRLGCLGLCSSSRLRCSFDLGSSGFWSSGLGLWLCVCACECV